MYQSLKDVSPSFIYSFFDQSVNYLTDGKGKKDGAQPMWLPYLTSKTGRFNALLHPLAN